MSAPRDLGRATVPDESYLDHIAAETRARADNAAEWTSEFTGAPTTSTDAIATALTGAGDEITGLLHRIHELAETAYEEVESVAAIAAVLESRGIAVETGLYGVETTLQATTGNGNGRTIAILAEYDALPEIGHACGHNLI
ncbi:amidohydrolase, partial [Geobacillus sp. MMMUD3]|nr:amidohydrolase [Geobacillus sp. MMMUD3]